MSLDKIANETLSSIEAALGSKLSEHQRKAVVEAIQKSLSQTVDHASRKHRKAAERYLGADEDLAHKFAEELKRANVALKANLESLR